MFIEFEDESFKNTKALADKQNPKKFLSKEQISINKFRAISDFISGMTDRYAINLNNKMK